MRISKIIVALLVSVVALTALTGVAAAWGSFDAMDNSGNIKGDLANPFEPLENVYAGGLVVNDAAGDIYVTKNVSWADGDPITAAAGRSPDIVVFTLSPVSSDDINLSDNGPVFVAQVNNTGGIPYPGAWDILYDVNQDGYYNVSGDYVDYVGCTGFHTVPEFATIAIPAIAVLGLFLFFNKRKHKKE